MSGLNLKNFKKVKTEKEFTVMRSDKGHEIRIAHSGLTSRRKTELDNLPIHAAEGAMIEAPPTSSEEMTPENADRAPASAPLQVTPAPSMVDEAQQQTAGQNVNDPNLPVAQRDAYIKENQAWQQDLANGHITPQTYGSLFAKKDTPAKIGTIFGLLLSGAGSGLAHQPNAALQMMNQQIQNDLDAQKTSKSNAQNFLRMNQANQLNKAQVAQAGAQTNLTQKEADTKAYTLARMQMNSAALHKLVTDMQKLPVGSPQRQQAEKALGMLSQQVQSENFNIADRAATMQGLTGMIKQGNGQSNPEQQFQENTTALKVAGRPELAQDMETHHYSGLEGRSSVPIGGADKEKLDSGFGFQRQLDDFIDWTKNHSGDLSPSDIKAGQAKAADLQGAYRQATHGGVYKEGEQNFIAKLISENPTAFFNKIRVLPQLNALSKTNSDRIDQTAKNLGFEGYKHEAKTSKSGPQEGTTGKANGKPVVFKGGKWSYQ